MAGGLYVAEGSRKACGAGDLGRGSHRGQPTGQGHGRYANLARGWLGREEGKWDVT